MWTIAPISPLPAITAPAVIDGTSQPGYDPANPSPKIELAGQLILSPNVNGLTVSADDRPPTCGGTIATNCIPSSLVTNYDSLYASTLGLLNSTALVAARDANLNPLPPNSLLIGFFKSSAPQFYAQDTWRITPSLTLTYGLNYGWQSGPTEENGLVSILSDPATGAPISSASFTWPGKQASLSHAYLRSMA